MVTLREIITGSADDLAQELASLNVDQGGIGIMARKARLHVLRLRQLSSPAANILKQEMLSLGADCATGRTVILGDENPQDVLVLATRRQLDKAAKKLKAQPFGLKKIARQIEAFLEARYRPGRTGDLLSRLVSGSEPPLIMGILNVTPDSFSDGGKFATEEAAVARGRELSRQGADLIDVGGESTRPGSDPVPAEVEQARVVPVLAALAGPDQALLSIDTMKADVAAAALQAGAALVNDVSAGRHDPEMLPLIASHGCPVVLMHMQGQPRTMQEAPAYDNLMDDLHRFFDERLAAATKAGVPEENIILDPGIGFGKRLADNYEILRRLPELLIFGRPILVGVSRKSFLQNPAGEKPLERLSESITAGALAMANGADLLRVHDVEPAVKSRTIVRRLLEGA